jgi:hypothetical protein
MQSAIQNVNELVKTVATLEGKKKDLVVDTSIIQMHKTADGDQIEIPNYGRFSIEEHAQGQIASRLNIPKRFYDILPQKSEMARVNLVNTLWKDAPEKRLLRCLTGNDTVRAYLSNSFRCYDNLEVLSAVMPTLKNLYKEGIKFTVKGSGLTSRKMYLQIIFDSMTTEVVEGDVVSYGVTLTNSEVGAGAWDLSETVWRLICQNGMVGNSLVRKTHVGSKLSEGDGVADYFKEDTVKADIQLQAKKVRDVFEHAVNTGNERLEGMVSPLRTASEIVLPDQKIEVAEEVTKRFSFTDDENGKLIEQIIKGDDLSGDKFTGWDLINGVTSLAHFSSDLDRQHYFENVGSKIAKFTENEWGDLLN